MTVPAGTDGRVRIPFVSPSSFTRLLKAAFNSNTDGLRDTVLAVVGNTRTVVQASDGSWPTITRAPWLHYRWVARYDPSRPPGYATGAADGDEYVGHVAAFLPVTA